MTHTQGPWLIRKCSASTGDGAVTIEHVSDGLRSVIAEMHEYWLCPEHDGRGVAGNACLIAAAPALLAWAREIVRLWDSVSRGNTQTAGEFLLQAGRTLIARIDDGPQGAHP